MHAAPVPTKSNILFASNVICSSWTEPRRAARHHKAVTHQRQLLRGLLGHAASDRKERTPAVRSHFVPKHEEE